MAQVEKDDKFGGPRGPVTLDGLFGEGSWLGVRHIVADAGWDAACPSGTRFSSETADVLVARLGSRRSRPAGPGRAGGCPGTPARQRDRLRPPGPAG